MTSARPTERAPNRKTVGLTIHAKAQEFVHAFPMAFVGPAANTFGLNCESFKMRLSGQSFLISCNQYCYAGFENWGLSALSLINWRAMVVQASRRSSARARSSSARATTMPPMHRVAMA